MNLLTKIVPFALMIAGLAGCITDKTEAVPAVRGGEAAFRVSVPGMKAPTTRALDAAKEKEITAIDLVFFTNGSDVLIEHHRIGASDIGAGTGGNDYHFSVKGIADPENITIAVIANASTEVTAALAAVGGPGAYKTDFLMALEAGAPLMWNTSEGSYRTIPMYGEVSITGSIYGAVEQSVNLTRMLAKVDVVNGVAPSGTPSDGDFELTAVHVVNRNRAGLIAPKWDAAGVPEITPATTPNLPTAPDMVTWTAVGDELTYNLFGATSLMDEIYLFESAALSGDNPATSDGLRLVFEGNYTSDGVTKHYYYPVDFTAPSGAYMPVLRNHRYLFTITEASGRGYDGLGEAVAAFGVMSNLRTSLVVVDESGIRHMVWNGEHFLGVSEKAFTVPVAGASGVALQIATDYADGWKAEVENAAANTWLTLGASSGSIADKTLTFSAEPLTGDEWAFRSGAILLTAGRLETRVTVIQGEYKIVAEPANQYLLDGTTLHSFKVKSNTQWAVRSVSDPDNILLDSDNHIADMIANQSGGNNTATGDDFTFTLVGDTDGLLSGKTFTVTFHDPTEKVDDITVVVTAVACGCNGTAFALRIGTNGYENPGTSGKTYLTHMYGGKCWMVQNSKEGSHSGYGYGGIGTIFTGHGAVQVLGANGYYYYHTQAVGACPSGWHLPTATEVTDLIAAVSGSNFDIPEGRWWCGTTTGNGANATTAFAGYFATNNSSWYSWGIIGLWWYGSDGQRFRGNVSDVVTSTETGFWQSVRCVRDQ